MRIRNAQVFVQSGWYQRMLLGVDYLAQQVKAIFDSVSPNGHMWLPGASVPVLGPELLPSGAWVSGSGAVITGETANGFTATSTAGDAFATAYKTITGLIIGNSYLVTASCNALTSGTANFRVNEDVGSATGAEVNLSVGSGVTQINSTFVASSTSEQIGVTLGQALTSIASSNISVKEILSYTSLNNGFSANNYLDSAGTTPASTDGLCGLALDAAISGAGAINASQPIVGSKPIERRGIVNLLLGSSSPVVRIVTPSATPYTLAMIGTGSVTVSGGHVGTLTGTGAADLVVMNFTPTAIATTFTPAGSVTSFGLFQGTLTAAQIASYGGIPLTTTAAASSSLGPQYWEFLASANRYVSLSSVPFQQNEDWVVATAARVDSATGYPSLFGESDGTLLNYIKLLFSLGKPSVEVVSAGGGSAYISSSSTFVGAVCVIVAHKVSGVLKLRVNGVQVASGACTASTAMTMAALGALPVTGGAATNHTGHMYPVISLKGTFTNTEIALLEQQAAKCAGGRLVAGAFVSDF